MKDLLNKANNKWTRLVILIVVSINTGGMILDAEFLPYSNEELASGISIGAMIVVELWNHWKNNSYTNPAKEADVYLESRKNKLRKK